MGEEQSKLTSPIPGPATTTGQKHAISASDEPQFNLFFDGDRLVRIPIAPPENERSLPNSPSPSQVQQLVEKYSRIPRGSRKSYCETCRKIDDFFSVVECGTQIEAANLYLLGKEFKLGELSWIKNGVKSCKSCRSMGSVLERLRSESADAMFTTHVPPSMDALPLDVAIAKIRLEDNGVFLAHVLGHMGELKIEFRPKRPDCACPCCRHLQPQLVQGRSWRFQVPGAHLLDQVGRVFDPHHIDVNLIKSWIKCCSASHGSKCQPPQVQFQKVLEHINVVDVEAYKVVSIPMTDRYVALSYVWGCAATVRALKENIEDLRRPSSLSPHQNKYMVPNTIKDAICLVKSIGEKYLWVDALCIVQDDFETLPINLAAMASIYRGATLTIVAFHGTDANAGLPGVPGGSKYRDIPTLKLPSTVLRHAAGLHSIRWSNWVTRGWTFQEEIFSRRLLYMCGPDGTITWRCRTTKWLEEIYSPTEDIDWINKHPRLSSLNAMEIATDKVNELGTLPKWPDLEWLEKVFQNYNIRKFTYEDDVINAIEGLLQELSMVFDEGFYYGIPEAFFDHFMLWQPVTPLRRRKPTRSDQKLPSWSWAGWEAHMSWSMAVMAMDYVVKEFYRQVIQLRPVVQWRKKNKRTEEYESIANSYSKFADLTTAPASMEYEFLRTWKSPDLRDKLPPGWSQGRFFGGNLCHEEMQDPQFHYPIPMPSSGDAAQPRLKDPYYPFLYGKVSRARFRLRAPSPPITTKSHSSQRIVPRLVLEDKDGKWAGIMDMTGLRIDAATGETAELIAISKGSTPNKVKHQYTDSDYQMEWEDEERPKNTERYEFYNVLWIEWEDKIAYRVALGRVLQSVWDQEAEPELIDITLG